MSCNDKKALCRAVCREDTWSDAAVAAAQRRAQQDAGHSVTADDLAGRERKPSNCICYPRGTPVGWMAWCEKTLGGALLLIGDALYNLGMDEHWTLLCVSSRSHGDQRGCLCRRKDQHYKVLLQLTHFLAGVSLLSTDLPWLFLAFNLNCTRSYQQGNSTEQDRASWIPSMKCYFTWLSPVPFLHAAS